ncbi:MAG TPA: hypothetical protein VH599_03520 [Ktedonobacterales bacterium]|jgi:hypothetical protein
MESIMREIVVFWDRIKVHFSHHVVSEGKEASFWVAVSFLGMFGVVRYITYSIRKKKLTAKKNPHPSEQHHGFGFHDIVLPGGLHIHHAVPGIFLALSAGYLALVTGKKGTRPVSIMYGIGTALALDEFALWLELRDVYWSKDGRRSFDAVAIAGSLFMGGFALSHFGGAILRDIHERRTTGKYPPHHTELDVDLPPDIDMGAPSGSIPVPRAASLAARNNVGSKATTPRRAAH